MTWKLVGSIGVDSGLCWVGDPSYILHRSIPPVALGNSWLDFCNQLNHDEPLLQSFDYDTGHAGLGCCVATGYGKGVYPVLANILNIENCGDRVVEVRIIFTPDDITDPEIRDLLCKYYCSTDYKESCKNNELQILDKWKCPICGFTINVDSSEYITVGEPMCGNCDIDMELQ